MSVVVRYTEVCQLGGHDITTQSISFELNYVFKELEMQDLNL